MAPAPSTPWTPPTGTAWSTNFNSPTSIDSGRRIRFRRPLFMLVGEFEFADHHRQWSANSDSPTTIDSGRRNLMRRPLATAVGEFEFAPGGALTAQRLVYKKTTGSKEKAGLHAKRKASTPNCFMLNCFTLNCFHAKRTGIYKRICRNLKVVSNFEGRTSNFANKRNGGLVVDLCRGLFHHPSNWSVFHWQQRRFSSLM